jgi:hypothetical protein
MLRLFKKYDRSTLPFTGAVQGDQPEKSHNIIIYAGEYHCIHYRNILRKLKFKKIESTGSGIESVKTCISTEKITNPFFQKNKLLRESNTRDTNIRNPINPEESFDDSLLRMGKETVTKYMLDYKSKEDLEKERKQRKEETNGEDSEEEEEEDYYDDMKGTYFDDMTKSINNTLDFEQIFAKLQLV